MASSVTRTNIAVHSRSPIIVANYTFSCTRASSTSHEVTVTFSGTMRCQDSSSYYLPGSGYGLGFYVTSDSAGDSSSVSTRYGNLRTGSSSTSFNVSWTIEADSYDTIRISSDCMFDASGCGQNAEVSNFDEITAPAYNPIVPTAPSVSVETASGDPGNTADITATRKIKFYITSNDGSTPTYRIYINGYSATSGTYSSSNNTYSFTGSSYADAGESYVVQVIGYSGYNSSLSSSDSITLWSKDAEKVHSQPDAYLDADMSISDCNQTVEFTCRGVSYDDCNLDYILYINNTSVYSKSNNSSGTYRYVNKKPSSGDVGDGQSYTATLYVYDHDDNSYYNTASVNLQTYGGQTVGVSSTSSSGYVGGTFNITVETSPNNWSTGRDGNINVYYRVKYNNRWVGDMTLVASNVSGMGGNYTSTFSPENTGTYYIYGYVEAYNDDERSWQSSSYVTITASEAPSAPSFYRESVGLQGSGNFSINDTDVEYLWYAVDVTDSTYCKAYLRIHNTESPSSSYREILLSEDYPFRYHDTRYNENGYYLYLTSGTGSDGEVYPITDMLSEEEKSRGVVWISIYVELYDPDWGDGCIDSIQLNETGYSSNPICNAVVYTPNVQSLTDARLRLYDFPLQNKSFQIDKSVTSTLPISYPTIGGPYNENEFQFTLRYTGNNRASGFLDGFIIKIYDKSPSSSSFDENNYTGYKCIYVSDMGDDYSILSDGSTLYTIKLDAKEDLGYRNLIGYAVIEPFYISPSTTIVRADTLMFKLLNPFTQLVQPAIDLPLGVDYNPEDTTFNFGHWHNNKFRILMPLPDDLDYSYYDDYTLENYKYGDFEISINDVVYACTGTWSGMDSHSEIFSSNVNKVSTNNYKKRICINPSLMPNFPNVDTYTIKVRVQKSLHEFSTEDMEDYNGPTWSCWSEPITIINTPINSISVQRGDKIMHSHYLVAQNGCVNAISCYLFGGAWWTRKQIHEIIEGSKQTPTKPYESGEYLGMYSILKAIVRGVNDYCAYDRPAVKFPELPEFSPEIEKITADLDTTVSGSGNNYINLMIYYLNNYLQ